MAPSAAATSSAIQLGTYLTKEMNYFAKGDSRIPIDGWVRDARTFGGDLALLPFRKLPAEVKDLFGDIGSDVSIALKDADGVYWVALGGKGIVRVDFTEADTRDVFQYFFPAISMTATALRRASSPVCAATVSTVSGWRAARAWSISAWWSARCAKRPT